MTLDGLFKQTTREFRSSLRQGSDDVPLDDPRLSPKVKPPFPEQVDRHLHLLRTSIWVSWVTGEAQLGKGVKPLDPSTVGSEVWYGEVSGNYSHVSKGDAQVYSQLYPYEDLLNYTSGIIHHVRLHGLKANKRYYYKYGESSLKARSGEYYFETLPSPCRIPIVGDLGTYNSTSTIDHLVKNDPCLMLMTGDVAYSNNYRTTGGKTGSLLRLFFPRCSNS